MTVEVLRRYRLRLITERVGLLFGSLLFCFFVIEMGYRVLEPFPFFSNEEINDIVSYQAHAIDLDIVDTPASVVPVRERVAERDLGSVIRHELSPHLRPVISILDLKGLVHNLLVSVLK